MKPAWVLAHERKERYLNELSRLNAKYSTYHYKNTCWNVGAVGVVPNSEFLTGDRDKVNCPHCLRRLRKVAPLFKWQKSKAKAQS